MYRIAILSDVHADVHALTDALAAIDRMHCDAVVCAGDVVDFGLFPDETIALLAANVYVFAFGMSWGPVVWVLLGEKFPNSIRAAALSVAAGAQWIANWVISTTFPSLKNAGLGLAYGLYTFFALLSFYFVWKFVSESKGRELEDMTSQG